MKPRSFKLIKSYPNSENIGSVWKVFGDRYHCMNSSLDPADVENNSEFFEEIIGRQVLFRTEDGHNMYEGDDYLAVDPEDLSLVWSVADKESLKSKWLKFENRKSAEEYIFWNAPVLSLKDVVSIYPGINKEHNSPSHQAEQLKALVKSRL
jgi:hypothetical protein